MYTHVTQWAWTIARLDNGKGEKRTWELNFNCIYWHLP